MQNQARTSKLGKKLVFAVLIISSIITTVMTATTFYLDYNSELSKMEQQFEQIKKVNLQALAGSLYSVDDPLIDAQIDGLLNIDHVVSIRLFDESNEKIRDREKKDIEIVSGIEKSYEIFYTENGESEKMGRLELASTQVFLFERIFAQALRFFVSQGMKTTIVSFILLFVFYQLILKHVVATSKYMSRLELGQNGSQRPTRPLDLGRKPVNDELNKLEETVNKLVTEALSQLNSKQEMIQETLENLETHRKAIQQSSRLASIGEFSANIVHEIKNPLAVVIGSLHILLQQEKKGIVQLDPKVLEKIEMAKTAGERIARISDTMLRLSRGESSADSIVLINLGDFWKSLQPMFEHKKNETRVPIEVKFLAETGTTIQVDLDKLSMVVINLINNAFDESIKHQNPKITLEFAQKEDSLVLAVQDNGTGLTPEIVKKIFQPFFTTKASGKGTGLGLAFSKKIAQQLGGDITVDFDRPTTTFCITIPDCIKPLEDSIEPLQDLQETAQPKSA